MDHPVLSLGQFPRSPGFTSLRQSDFYQLPYNRFAMQTCTCENNLALIFHVILNLHYAESDKQYIATSALAR